MEKPKPPAPMDRPQVEMAMCCDLPLISTFLFPKAEWYCTKCHRTYGYLEVPTRAIPTADLMEMAEVLQGTFEQIARDCIPPRSRKVGCATCETNPGRYHEEHATEEALEKSKRAYAMLRGLEAGWNSPKC